MSDWNVTDWLAIYAALVSTTGVLWYVRIWWQDRGHIRVKQTFGLGSTAFGNSFFVILEAINIGKLPVHLQGAGFTIEGERTLQPVEGGPGNSNSQLPFELLPGRNLSIHIPANELIIALVEDNNNQPPKRAWFRDETGKTHFRKINERNFRVWVERIIKDQASSDPT